MSALRKRFRKGGSRLGVERGERYLLIPREVMESAAYNALPPWAVVVLNALAVQYYGRRNGSLALPWAEAHRLGVRTQAQLYSGLQILEAADLISCTRRGYLTGGRQLATLYGLTWRPIDDPAAGVTYDAGVSVSPTPTHAWARWTRPTDWQERVRTASRRARGKLPHACPYPTRAASPREESAAHPVRSGKAGFRSPREEAESGIPAHPVGETSKTSGGVRPVFTEYHVGRKRKTVQEATRTDEARPFDDELPRGAACAARTPAVAAP